MATPQDVVRGAIDVLQEKGWHQGSAMGRDGSVCALMALNSGAASTGDLLGDTLRSGQAILLVVGQLPEGFSGIPHWNDDPNTSYEDVILTLKRAAQEEDVD